MSRVMREASVRTGLPNEPEVRTSKLGAWPGGRVVARSSCSRSCSSLRRRNGQLPEICEGGDRLQTSRVERDVIVCVVEQELQLLQLGMLQLDRRPPLRALELVGNREEQRISWPWNRRPAHAGHR